MCILLSSVWESKQEGWCCFLDLYLFSAVFSSSSSCWEKMIISPTVTMELSISFSNSVKVCFLYLEVYLLGRHTIVVLSFCWIGPIVIMKCVCLLWQPLIWILFWLVKKKIAILYVNYIIVYIGKGNGMKYNKIATLAFSSLLSTWHLFFSFISVQFNSVAQYSLTLCDPMNSSTPGLPVHQQLLESTQTHTHWVSDAIQPSHPLLSPSPPALNLSQHQGLFKWVSSLPQVAKVLEFQLQHQSFQCTPRTYLL